jgi:uncharacterized protein YggE
MSTYPQVVVRGQAILTVPPDVADVMAVVRARARDRRTALDRARARQAEVAAVVDAAGDAVESAATAGVAVVDDHHGPHGRVPEPMAVVQTRLVLRRIDAAGELVVALAGLDDVDVEGPFWRMRPDSAVFEEARLAAIRDAVRRARLYAEAFGGQITGLVEVADAGLAGHPRDPGFGEMAGRVAMADAGGPRFDLTPEHQQVRGSVEVRFAMSAPDPEVFRQ